MALRIGDTAPDFTADTTEGRIAFHAWLGDAWGVIKLQLVVIAPACQR
jgi:alkyl hydroperoxide reductase subunit AhpC